ncbi:hypothetical protein OGAPHI_002523 [Ogataea philodendri]|uniref:phosphatidylinositol-3,4,5-trisphosphate 3-phosphatase n=1 Tax=Ogataea philodendri TaxID=1378263 RepID=A0A9P8PAN5_9ASCO|nr:uncharacterized protein OGAPHI_002523 [Ogataea philodendri]KAH3668768.1 hypothetical protein OGAPHI_002523 [Ogataea philodendri]
MLPAQGRYSSIIHGRKLDVSYILPNLAACSGPSDAVAQVCKNNISDLVEALNRNHGKGNWLLVNLRGEKIGYDPATVTEHGGRYLHRPLVDHNAMPFLDLLNVVADVEKYLMESPVHVVVIHCKYGKGRTGSVVVAYLMFKFHMSFDEANKVFRERRGLFRAEVTIWSQIRYLDYFGYFLHDKRRQQFYRVLMKSEFSAKDFTVKIMGPSRALFDNEKGMTVTVNNNKIALKESNFSQIVYECPEVHTPDIVVEFNFVLSSIMTGMGRFWINGILEYMQQYIATKKSYNYFERPSSRAKKEPLQVARCTLEIPWQELDGFKGTKSKGVKLLETVAVEFTTQFKSSEDLLTIQRQLSLAGMLGMKT